MKSDEHRFRRSAGFSPLDPPRVLSARMLRRTEVRAPSAPHCVGLFIRNTMTEVCAQTTKIWSAVTRHRFGFFGDFSPKKRCVQRPGKESRSPLPIRRRQVTCRKRGQVRALQNLWLRRKPRWVYRRPSVVQE